MHSLHSVQTSEGREGLSMQHICIETSEHLDLRPTPRIRWRPVQLTGSGAIETGCLDRQAVCMQRHPPSWPLLQGPTKQRRPALRCLIRYVCDEEKACELVNGTSLINSVGKGTPWRGVPAIPTAPKHSDTSSCFLEAPKTKSLERPTRNSHNNIRTGKCPSPVANNDQQ